MNNLNLHGIVHDYDYGEQEEKNIYMMNQPSTSQAHGQDAGNFFTNEEIDEAAISEELSTINTKLDQLNAPGFDGALHEIEPDVIGAIAMNEIMTHAVSELIAKVENALVANRQKQKTAMARIREFKEAQEKRKKICSVQQYLPPYFKDEFNFCAPLNEEAKHKALYSQFDPIEKEEKKWSASEVQRLKVYIQRAMLEVHLQSIKTKQQELYEKITKAGADVPLEMKLAWRDEYKTTERKIQYEQQRTLEDLISAVNVSDIDWIKIANIDFGGQRTPLSLQLKWFNEVSPRWNQANWSKEETAMLKQIVEGEGENVLWAMVAEKLGTNRTPWQCFEKYKSEIFQNNKEWTVDEDEKLYTLVNIFKVNGIIQWDKVTYYMPGRTRQQVRVRYTRSLDKEIKHGKWTEHEDLILMCQVSRYGAKNWLQIAKNVPGRTDVQCRERWSSVLDKRNIQNEWSLYDDNKLVFLANALGRNSWAKIARFMENRTGDQCRYRFQSLMTQKIKLSINSSQLKTADEMTDYEMRSTMKKMKLNRIYEKYETLMKHNNPDVSVDAVEQLLTSIEEKDKEGKKRAPSNRSTTTLAEEIFIKTELANLEKRKEAGETVSMQDLLDNIVIEDSDLYNYHRRRKGSKFVKDAKAKITEDTRKGRKIQLRRALQEDPAIKLRHDTIMNSSCTEEEKVDELHDILMDTVTRMDAHEFGIDFMKYWRQAGSEMAEELGKNITMNVSQDDLCKLKNKEPLGFKTTLPPSWFNCDYFVKLQKARPTMLKSAMEHFTKCDTSVESPLYPFDHEHQAGTESWQRLYMPINKKITESDAYLKTKAFLRNFLAEPMVFEGATLSTEERDKEKKVICSLKDREKESAELLSGARTFDIKTADERAKPIKERKQMKNLQPSFDLTVSKDEESSNSTTELSKNLKEILDNALQSQSNEKPSTSGLKRKIEPEQSAEARVKRSRKSTEPQKHIVD